VTFGPGVGYGEANNSMDLKVPEPVSIAILGMGLFGLGIVRRRKVA
jgi:PEP-CTERM motif